MFFTKNDVGVTLIAPAILGAVLGLLVYGGINPPTGTPVLAAVFGLGGVIVVSLAAYGFRRFLLPGDKKDIVE